MRVSSLRNRFGYCALGALILASPSGGADAEIVQARRGDLVERLLLTGELVAEEAVYLIVPNAGIWPMSVRWLAEDGIEVAAGDTLVEFDNSRLVSDLERLEEEAEEGKNRLASLRARTRSDDLQAAWEAEQAKTARDKAKIDTDVPEGLLSSKEYEERRLELQRAELRLAEAERSFELQRQASYSELARQEIQLARAREEARIARDSIAMLSIEAPRDGILLVGENREAGRSFRSGDNTYPGTTIASLPDLDSIRVEARLFDVDDGRVTEGMVVGIRLDAFPDLELEGRVLTVDRMASETSPESLRRTFKVSIEVQGLDSERMLPGMSVRVEASRRHENVVLLPRRAIEWPSESSPCARLTDGGLIELEVERCQGDDCVISAGLEVGESVLLQAGEVAP